MARRTTASVPPPDEAPEAPDASPAGADAGATDAPATDAPATGAAPDASATAPDAASASAPLPTESGFFSWLRGLGLQRQSGWLGGVCGGIATRIGLDPLLVRGIAVVLAVIGAPVALLYAVAWFLLPDETGTIHAQQLGRGRVTRALPGIVAVFLASFLPLTQGFWYAGALYWGDLGWGGATGRIIWTAVLLAAVITLVVWLARRATNDIPTTPATTDDRPETVPSFPAESAQAAGPDAAGAPGADATPAHVAPGTAAFAAASGAAASAPLTAPSEPPAPGADASAEELAAWKAQQHEWQRQRAAWAAEQRRSERERRQALAQEQAIEAARVARERTRIRRLTRPRASAGIVFLVLGVALVSGAIAAFASAQESATRGAEWMIGAGVLVLVLGAGTVAVALGRRRSGALAFFSILAVLALAVAVVLPPDRQTIPPGAGWGIDTSRDGRYAQLTGYTGLYIPDRDNGTVVVDLWQAFGTIHVDVAQGATVRIELTTDAAQQWVSVDENYNDSTGRYSGYRVDDGRWQLTIGEGEPDLVLRLWTGAGAWLNISSSGDSDTPLLLDPKPDSDQTWTTDAYGNQTETTPVPTPIPTEPAEGSTTEGATP